MKVVTIGRSSENDVEIKDTLVGRHHCQIVQNDNGKFSVVDFNSKNGTFVNGKRIKGEVPLKTNDEVRIGNTKLQWETYFSKPISSNFRYERETPPTPQPVPVQLPPLIPPNVNVNHNQKIEHFHGEVYKSGDDFKVPFFRKSGELIGSTAGCIASVAMILVAMVIFGLLLKTCS